MILNSQFWSQMETDWTRHQSPKYHTKWVKQYIYIYTYTYDLYEVVLLTKSVWEPSLPFGTDEICFQQTWLPVPLIWLSVDHLVFSMSCWMLCHIVWMTYDFWLCGFHTTALVLKNFLGLGGWAFLSTRFCPLSDWSYFCFAHWSTSKTE